MKVSVEKLPTSEAVLDVEVTWDEMQKASDKAYRKIVQKVDVQGFRRGKAPRTILERKLGKEYIYQEGLDDLITETYRSALQEHELTPISQPKVDAPIFEMEQPYHFSLTVPIVTPPILGDYQSLHFERPEAEVTSEEVEKELESLRGRQTEWVEVERPATYNDRVTVDLKLTSDEQKISDLKDNPFELTNERSGLFKGMDEQVVGMQPSESKSFSTTIPEDYINEKYRGKQADFFILLHKIEEKHEPELDDALAEKVSGGEITTLEDLRKALSDNILENKKRKIRDELRDQVINAVIEQSQITLHPLLIDEEAEEMLHQMTHMLERQGISMDQYFKMTRKNKEEFLKETRPEAENRAKRQLVLDEVAHAEKIEITPEDLEALFNAYAQAGQELPSTEEQIRLLAISYRREKAITHLVALTTDPDPDSETEEELSEEASVEHAEAAALAGDSLSDQETTTNATQVVHVEGTATQAAVTEPVGDEATATPQPETPETPTNAQ
ncbi:MAG: trigger factor [Ktedonobacteraceae bacterium]